MKIARPSLLLAAVTLQIFSFGQWTGLGTGFTTSRSTTTFGNAIYVAHSGGFSKSTDNGVSWAAANNGIMLVSGQYNAQSVGHNDTYLFAGSHSGIYRSNDAGATWTNANGTLTATAQIYANKFFHFGIATFAIFTGSIANGGGIHRTNDSGTTWLIGNSGMGSNAICYNISTDGTNLYAATSVGLYKSTDGGQQWSAVAGANFAIYAVQNVPGRLVAVTTFGYRYSNDNGATWLESTGDPTNPTKGEMVAYDGKVYAVSNSGGCTVSLDNGATYSTFNMGLSPVDQVAQEEFHAAGNRMYIGAFQDLYYITGTTVSVSSQETDHGVSLYPTVFTDGFNVDLTKVDGSTTLILIDVLGQEVAQQRTVGGGIARFDRNGLANGRYTCLMIDANGERSTLGAVVAE